MNETMTPKTRLPNLIIFKTDQQRADTLSCLGHPVSRTPHLDRLAARGAVFENAFCCSPLCVPSRVSFFTGQYPHRTGAINNEPASHLQASQWSFLDELHRRGYALGLAGKNHAFSDEYLATRFVFREEYGRWGKTHGRITASDQAVRRWLTDPTGPGQRLADGRLMEGFVPVPLPFPAAAGPTWRIAEDAIRFIDAQRTGPFFLHCSFPDPHFPHAVCEPYYSRYAADAVALEAADVDWHDHPFAHFVQSQSNGYDRYTAAERRQILALYYGQIACVDDAVGAVLDAVADRGLTERTLVVFTSDHGDFGGRYGLIGKTKAFYEPLIRIPLLIAVPGLPPGLRIRTPISNVDVMPTLAEALGLPIPDQVQGRSAWPVLTGRRAAQRTTVVAELGGAEWPPPPMPHADFPAYNAARKARDGVFWFCEYTTRGRAAMIRRDQWKYCCYAGDTAELYDLAADPMETRNLAGAPELAQIRDELKAALHAQIPNAPGDDSTRGMSPPTNMACKT